MYCAASAQAAPGDDGPGKVSAHSSQDAGPSSAKASAGKSLSAKAAQHRASKVIGTDAAKDSSDAPSVNRRTAAKALTPAKRLAADAVDVKVSATYGPHFVPPSVRAAVVDPPVVPTKVIVGDTAGTTATVVEASDPVDVALGELAAAQTALHQYTWGSGNVLAGLAAVVPQLLLANAASSLTGWQTSNAGLQSEFAATVGTPIVHDIAGIQLAANNLLPLVAQSSMDGASLLLPVVGLFGAENAASVVTQLVSEARTNGQVYAVIPVDMRDNGTGVATEPIIYISVNGGERVPVLIDTGSTGLVMDPRYVGLTGLGDPIAHGSSGYGEDFSYNYDVYDTTVDFGNGVTTTPTTVRIVSLESVQAFQDYNDQGAGYVGILGIGPNANTFVGDTDATVPMTALAGLLNKGMLLDERHRVLVLGPAPLPARVTLPGAPSTDVLVKIGNLAVQPALANIDSGGVFGSLPEFLVAGTQYAAGIPPGTVISVYNADGSQLLYSYTTTERTSPTVVPGGVEGDWYVTGYFPFDRGPIYIDLQANNGSGETRFVYT
ncbi:MAG: PecA family PE domain-processing aspartic protease [Mycobacterium sp.]